MRRLAVGLLVLSLAGVFIPAAAQDSALEEVVVTAFRKLNPDDEDGAAAVAKAVPVPAAVQMLRRQADFAVQQVVVVSDTREEDQRRSEIYAMTKNALDQSSKSSVLLATGELVVEPLIQANYKELEVIDDEEGGGEAVKFLVKVPLAGSVNEKEALARIERFLKAVPAVGRAEIKPYSELTLSVVNPEQYRGAIIDLVAKDTASTTGRFGQGYGVEVTGLDRPVQWRRSGLTEVQLFLPATSTVRPRN
jgi:hypothetical protein